MFNVISKYVSILRQKIVLMITRALITGVNESGGLQVVQVNLGNGEIIDAVEHIQNFGFTSFPVNGSEAIVLCIGGDRENPIVISTDSSKHRPKLSEGESAIYNAFNRIIKLKDGNIEIGINTFKKLINEEFKAMFNNHVHNFIDIVYPAVTSVIAVTGKPASLVGTGGVSTGANPSIPPTGLLGDVITNNEMSDVLRAE